MFDLTAGETKKFELLPEESWVLARIVGRGVIRYDGTTYKNSTDDILRKTFATEAKAKASGDDGAIAVAREEMKRFQFQFLFQPLAHKKFANYRVRGNTGLFISFVNSEGEDTPNKLAKFYLGAGGAKVEKGKNVDIDSIVGNYVAVKVKGKKNQKNGKVYQDVYDIRELTDDELIAAKTVEAEVRKIEDALRTAEAAAAKSVSDVDQDGPTVEATSFQQKPVLEQTQERQAEPPF